MTTDHMRAFRFQEEVLARTSTRTMPLPWGTAYFNDDFPLRYDANMAIADRPLGGATADDVAGALDDAYEGFRHREVEFASAVDADAIAMGLAEHGYSVEGLVVMVLRRGSDRESDLAATEELTFDDYRPLSLEIHARQPWSSDPAVAQSMAEFRKVLADGIGARFFGQRVDGALAGSCELYVMGDTAQIEDVNTLEEFRGRGIARNVVLRAAREASEAGASFVFLFADVDDWPRHLYSRLGFDDVGQSRLFMRTPEGDTSGRPENASP
ncbi:MAG TPA: GNAT family N-acetyltransferase [Actinomycetota bacterium]|nr:GNAT family N-acetyltransferase [Actinomycetota bacterium]